MKSFIPSLLTLTSVICLNSWNLEAVPSETEVGETATARPAPRTYKVNPVADAEQPMGFHSYHLAEKNVWVGMEPLTDQSAEFWTKWIGYNAWCVYTARHQEEMNMAMSMNMGGDMMLPSVSGLFEMFPFAGRCFETPPLEEKDLHPDFKELREAFGTYSYSGIPHVCYREGDFTQAWSGFHYNLLRSSKMPTWIAYVSSDPLTGPLSATELPTSPHIKMAMTVCAPSPQTEDALPVYLPLGICRGAFAQEYNKRHGLSYRGLSIDFHGVVANFVGKENPAIRYMGVRPIKSMKTIFDQSDVPTFSCGFANIPKNGPYVIHRETARYLSHGKETLEFGDGLVVMHDPRTNETWQIPRQHPFAWGKFYAVETDWKYLEAFPFVMADRKTLAAAVRFKEVGAADLDIKGETESDVSEGGAGAAHTEAPLSDNRHEGLAVKVPDGFSTEKYLAHNPDLAVLVVADDKPATAKNLVHHYQNYGHQEARVYDVPLDFDAEQYLLHNPDLTVLVVADDKPATAKNLALHYQNYGKRETRVYTK